MISIPGGKYPGAKALADPTNFAEYQEAKRGGVRYAGSEIVRYLFP